MVVTVGRGRSICRRWTARADDRQPNANTDPNPNPHPNPNPNPNPNRQMMSNHKIAAEKLKDRHARQTHGLAKAHNLAMANLEGAHRVERWRVVDNCKKQVPCRVRERGAAVGACVARCSSRAAHVRRTFDWRVLIPLDRRSNARRRSRKRSPRRLSTRYGRWPRSRTAGSVTRPAL